MSPSLRIGLLLASIIALAFVIICVVKKKLNIKYSIVWILWSLLSLFMAAFPETFYGVSHLLGIEMPVNGVFLIMITLLYGLSFYSYIMISKHNDQIIQLTYEIASLKKELEDLGRKRQELHISFE